MTEPSFGGRYFEELPVGYEIVSPGRQVTEEDVLAFASLSGDRDPLHVDAEYARTTPYGERIAHGLLGLALASGLAAQSGILEGTVLAFTSLDWRFRAPIRFGDTIRLQARVERARAVPRMGGGIVTLAAEVLNQRNEVTQAGEWTLLIRGRGLSGTERAV